MDRRTLAKGGVVYTGLLPASTLLALFLGSRFLDFPFPLAALGTFVLSLAFATALFGLQSTGLESSAATARGGVRTVTDPSRFGAPRLPGKVPLVLYFLGLGIMSLAGLGLAR